MPNFYINGTINGLTSDAQKLAVLTYLKDNYASKIPSAKARKDSEEITFQLIETVFATMVSTLTAIQQVYTTQFNWELDAQDYGG